MIKRKLLMVLSAAFLVGCAAEGTSTATEQTTTVAETTQTSTTQAETTEAKTTEAETTTEEATTEAEPDYIDIGKEIMFSVGSGFYTENTNVELKLKTKGTIYYTIDGSEATTEAKKYEGAIHLASGAQDNPNGYTIRAIAVLEDGTVTEEAAQSYILDAKVKSRFSTDVFYLTVDPDDLYDKKEGILQNSHGRGAESERKVFVTAFDKDGNVLFEQFAGIRVYGGASRDSYLKSFKLFARKSYDSENGKFKYNLFDTIGADGEEIEKYSKLVLRNTGNDMQFAYLRDEYMQTLAKQEGFDTYEGVEPVVGYLNGSYYCFYWLHENYTNTYFEEKFGKTDGEFVVLEGKETEKKTDDEDEKVYVDAYNEIYNNIINGESLTNEEAYKYVTDHIDVENYLDYYAWNLYINNNDWPQNNYKCYVYVPAEGEEYGEGVFDGKYRYLLHDMDYSLGLYEQSGTSASYDTLAHVLKANDMRWSPLFAMLMEREDCKEYFVNEMLHLMNGTLSAKNMLAVLDEVDALRSAEMEYYYNYLEKLRNAGHDSIWTRPDHLSGYMQLITNYINSRPKYMVKYLKRNLKAIVEEKDGVYTLTGFETETEE